MKYKQKLAAIELRKAGHSINSIAHELGVAKSSVSLWTRNIKLNEQQLRTLSTNPYTNATVEKRRLARLANELNKRDLIVKEAQKDIDEINDRDLWMLGVALYWAEGGKTQRLVRFSNGDPGTIKLMMKFFKQICSVTPEKFRGYIHIHSHLDHVAAEHYWSKMSGIPPSQFFKTYRRKPIDTPSKKDSLPYGVMDIYVLDTKLFLRITGWIKAIAERN